MSDPSTQTHTNSNAPVRTDEVAQFRERVQIAEIVARRWWMQARVNNRAVWELTAERDRLRDALICERNSSIHNNLVMIKRVNTALTQREGGEE